jgi:GrpB-like predicted nucleotidyltransferase (UPF0157 family)
VVKRKLGEIVNSGNLHFHGKTKRKGCIGMSEEIKVVKYNPQWAIDFVQEKCILSSLFGDQAIAIEHIGSTSIPGQEAKPIIDIFVGVSPFPES